MSSREIAKLLQAQMRVRRAEMKVLRALIVGLQSPEDRPMLLTHIEDELAVAEAGYVEFESVLDEALTED